MQLDAEGHGLQAVDTGPAELLGEASPRTVDGRPFPFWELNDVDVSKARDGDHKLYFMTQVAESQTATSVWAHAADARTYFPQQDVPSGIASGPIDAVDACIEIVWPHDAAGTESTAGESASRPTWRSCCSSMAHASRCQSAGSRRV